LYELVEASDHENFTAECRISFKEAIETAEFQNIIVFDWSEIIDTFITKNDRNREERNTT
jgi:hypothetical protein